MADLIGTNGGRSTPGCPRKSSAVYERGQGKQLTPIRKPSHYDTAPITPSKWRHSVSVGNYLQIGVPRMWRSGERLTAWRCR